MTGIGNLTLNALAGTVLLDAWLLVAMGLQSGRRAALVFVPLLAAQAAVLYVLRAPLDSLGLGCKRASHAAFRCVFRCAAASRFGLATCAATAQIVTATANGLTRRTCAGS